MEVLGYNFIYESFKTLKRLIERKMVLFLRFLDVQARKTGPKLANSRRDFFR